LDITEQKRTEEEHERLLAELRNAQNQLLADFDAMRRLQKLGALFVQEGNLESVLGEIVDAAIAIAGADFGNVQLLDPASRTLRIVAHRGFPQWWLDYWNTVAEGHGTCGTALESGERIIVEDVESNPIFARSPALEIQLRAGVRAVQSTPLVSRSGKRLGMFSTHYRTPQRPDERALRLLDLLARQAADIIERAQAEEALQMAYNQLREADLQKDRFLAVLSHELRNPLAPITNSLYILDHSAPGGEQANRARQIIGRQVSQLSNLVNDLVDVTRISRNRVQLNKERLELNDTVRRVVEDHRTLFERANMRLDFEPAPRPVPVNADRTRAAQVVGNLLQNAAKFGSDGGRTRVLVADEGKEALVRVDDDGVGMSTETLARLFQPFVQAEKTLDRTKGGLGLGLVLVKGLVELHGGRVSVHSAGLGKGTKFTVRLPLDTGLALEGTRPQVELPKAHRRVLIIEDNADAAESLREVLKLGDHEVAVAYNGPEGIAKARESKPDVVFCDIGLPGMDGFDVARAFRAEDGLKTVFLVALSGYARPEDQQRALDAGFDRNVAKPPNLEKLEELLSDLPSSRATGAQIPT
jgi:signal transduction histidine kinase/CheY-like chemotaxis protein